MRGRHHPDPVVAGVGDEQVARGVRRHTRTEPISLAAVAGPPSPENPLVAVPGHGVDVARRSSPARRTCRCWAATTRIRLLSVSAITRLPAPSTATPPGKSSSAPVAGPPSPENPALGAVAGDRVDVPGGHRLPVERAGAWPPPPAPGCCSCRRSPGCPTPSTATPSGYASSAVVAGPPSPANPAVPSRPRCRCPRRSSPARRTCRCLPPPPAPAVAGVGDHQVARAVHRHSPTGRPARPWWPGRRRRRTRRAAARHGVDVPGGHRLPVERARGSRHHPDPAVVDVGDDHVARAVQGHAVGAELGRGGRAAVTGEPGVPFPATV